MTRCSKCQLWFPFPKSRILDCPHCGKHIIIDINEKTTIVSSDRIKDYKPIIVGENIHRYKLTSNLWIDSEKPGISYKDICVYKPPKILVRKTGVGISATIDYSNAYTNQVVYIFRPKDDTPLPIELFLGILNSRAMYYYLVKNYGETEWRSHPYLTQKQVMDLPLPSIEILQNGKSQLIESFAKTLNPFLVSNKELPPGVDAKIERLVAGIFGLHEKDYERVYSTLDYVEELLPIRALKKINISDIFGNKD